MNGATTRNSIGEYVKGPAVNAGLLSTLIDRCAYAAWFESWLNPNRPAREEKTEMDIGSVAHAIVLEGSADCCVVLNPEDYPAQKGGIPEGWTNPSIRAARDAARAEGKIPLLPKHMTAIKPMVEAVQRYIDTLRESEPEIWRAFQPDGGESELSITWTDNGTPCRIRPDRISADRKLMVDLKFCGVSAEPNSWSRKQLAPMGYDVSAGFYRRGVKHVFDVDANYVFLVTETEPPYLSSLIGFEPSAVALADRKAARALAAWRQCVAADKWPTYPNRVCYFEPPPWELARWDEREASGDWRLLFPELAEDLQR